jgi:TRAP-type C4-dicarboxylate transport system permease large subunit
VAGLLGIQRLTARLARQVKSKMKRVFIIYFKFILFFAVVNGLANSITAKSAPVFLALGIGFFFYARKKKASKI